MKVLYLFCALFSPECQHMIRSTLTWDPRKRITTAEIFDHVWLSGESTKVRLLVLTVHQ